MEQALGCPSTHFHELDQFLLTVRWLMLWTIQSWNVYLRNLLEPDWYSTYLFWRFGKWRAEMKGMEVNEELYILIR